LLGRGAVFASDWAKLPCVDSMRPVLLALDPVQSDRKQLALAAGCEILDTTQRQELGMCCPEEAVPPHPQRTGGHPSCEQAREDYLKSPDAQICRAPPEATSGTHGPVLNDGRYMLHCRVAAHYGIEICAAVQHGKAAGVTVRTTPPNARLGDCIAQAVWGLVFPSRPTMDITHTTFAPRAPISHTNAQ
jgi:hypothetical protein